MSNRIIESHYVSGGRNWIRPDLMPILKEKEYIFKILVPFHSHIVEVHFHGSFDEDVTGVCVHAPAFPLAHRRRFQQRRQWSSESVVLYVCCSCMLARLLCMWAKNRFHGAKSR